MQDLNPDGVPPAPRISHSMTYNESMNFIVIHGGKNESCDHFFLNDTFILQLNNNNHNNNNSNLKWLKVNDVG